MIYSKQCHPSGRVDFFFFSFPHHLARAEVMGVKGDLLKNVKVFLVG